MNHRRAVGSHAERGQVLPLWAFGAITTFALMFLAINYANAVRYQIRAQNDADSAAAAAISLQAQKFNEMNIMLYAANVEEYRVRKQLDATLLAANLTGGCDPDYYIGTNGNIRLTSTPDGAASCDQTFQQNRTALVQSVNRYTADLSLLNDVVTNVSVQNKLLPDIKSLLNQLGAGGANCVGGVPSASGAISGTVGDCAMTYGLVGAQTASNLLAVQEDADGISIPGPANRTNAAAAVENADLWAPLEVDVTACDIVKPIVPNFGPIHLPNSYAIGRAAAADVMIESDWLDPGVIADPVRGSSPKIDFQPYEAYSSTTTDDWPNAYRDWYGVDFGGSAAYAFPTQGAFSETLDSDEMSVRVGWWSSIPIRPGFETQTSPVITEAQACPQGS